MRIILHCISGSRFQFQNIENDVEYSNCDIFRKYYYYYELFNVSFLLKYALYYNLT